MPPFVASYVISVTTVWFSLMSIIVLVVDIGDRKDIYNEYRGARYGRATPVVDWDQAHAASP